MSSFHRVHLSHLVSFHFLLIVAAALFALPAWAAPSSWRPAPRHLPPNVEQLDTEGDLTQYRLKSNGMTILLSPNHAAPVFTFYVVYHVGSRNESPGNTGSAHLLEHLLFNKSTENFGRAKGHKTFQEVLYEAGADFSSTNMTTWNDRMTGYSTLPSDKLELAMKIEADRLARGLILDSERQPEMSVVRNEYEIGENDPSNALNKAVIGAAIVAHPYHWDTIGYRSDIEGVSTDKLREHYRNYFWPNNSEAIVTGDFDPLQALRLFDREFGAFPRSPNPIPQVITQEPPQEGERRVTVKRPGQVGIVQVAYMRPGALHPDFMTLDVMATLLSSGVNSPLYKALVETGLASDVNAYNFTFMDPYPIYFEATVAPGRTHEEVENALKRVLQEVATNGVSDVELRRAQEQIEVAVIRSRDGTYNLASNLAEAVASANWKWFVEYIDNMKAVTTADVKRVAATYFVPEHATVGWFVPTAGGGNAPAVAAVRGPEAGRTPARSSSSRKNSKVSPSKAGAATAPPGSTFAERTVRRVLPNGILVDVVENHTVPTVAIQALVLSGGMTAPPRQPAIPFLTSEMLQRGTTTKNKNRIGELLDDAGARLTFVTNLYETNATASGLSRDTGLLLQLLAEEIRSPAFPDSELEKAKSEYKSTVLRLSESTNQRAFDRLTQLAFPEGHPYRAATKDEMLASIEATRLEDLKRFHKERYVGSSLILAVVGDVNAREVAAQVEKLFGSLEKGAAPVFDLPRVQPGAASRDAVTLHGKANMNLIYGHASGLRRTDPDYEAALVANAALGQTALSSRIGKRVRDTEGLSYNLSSRFNMSDYLDGVWMVNVAVAPVNLNRAMVSTREEIEKYVKEGITPAELETQKSFFAGNYNVRLGSNGGVAGALVAAEKFGYGPAYLDEFPKRIERVTLEQANQAIKDHFRPDKMNVVVAGDLEKVPE
jgi:zinc protease